MTHSEAIKRLDVVIAEIRTHYTPISSERDAEQSGKRIIAIATNVLKEICASERIQKAARDVYFGRDSKGFLQMYLRNVTEAERQTAETYMLGVKNTIDILQTERDRHQRIIDDEAQRLALDEQRRGNKIQHSALWCSIIATIISLVALVVAVVK